MAKFRMGVVVLGCIEMAIPVSDGLLEFLEDGVVESIRLAAVECVEVRYMFINRELLGGNRTYRPVPNAIAGIGVPSKSLNVVRL